ncbi:MAG: hypothetical protein N7Q72_06080, partial [Spiroplasma sp. Tabriz.8]|nr:hypothetical protein [Spiroplasma sp. Tabriz.8]
AIVSYLVINQIFIIRNNYQIKINQGTQLAYVYIYIYIYIMNILVKKVEWLMSIAVNNYYTRS